jgi:hypothetical protein
MIRHVPTAGKNDESVISSMNASGRRMVNKRSRREMCCSTGTFASHDATPVPVLPGPAEAYTR